MLRTFNCGIGMAVCVDSADTDAATACLNESGEQVFRLGEIVESEHSEVIFQD